MFFKDLEGSRTLCHTSVGKCPQTNTTQAGFLIEIKEFPKISGISAAKNLDFQISFINMWRTVENMVERELQYPKISSNSKTTTKQLDNQLSFMLILKH